MVAETMSTAPVVGLMNDWYILMRNQEIEKLKEIRRHIDKMIFKNRQEEKVLIYYSLLDFRHRLLMKEKDASHVLNEIETNVGKMDDVLTFYFYFFKGMYAYDQKRFNEAIESYNKAEERLALLPSVEKIERAEFFYKVGAAYFHLDYLSLALQHAKAAHAIFEKELFYEKRNADSMVLLGQIYADMNDFENASQYFQEARKVYEQLKQSEWIAIINQNLGWFYSKMGQHREAIEYYKLCLNGNVRPEYQLPTLFLLTQSYLKIGELEAAAIELEKGIEIAEANDNQEFLHKLKILKAEHLSKDEQDFEKALEDGIDYFRGNKMWELVQEYGQKLAAHFFCQKNYQKSAIYYKMVNESIPRNLLKG